MGDNLRSYMATVSHAELPLFERFNQVAGDDTLFDEVAREGFTELPADDVFMVAHQMIRDTPYGPRPYHELTYVMEGHAVARIGKQEVHLLPDSLLLAPPSCHHGLVATDTQAIVAVLCLRPELFSSGVFAELIAQDTTYYGLDLYGRRAPAASVNFVTCHDGFTLYDLVSYNEKHNRDNGEDNRDGSNDNMSWNFGAEGETDDPGINALRLRQMKNMLTVLLTSRGIPMLLSGDEFANTQYGNNNAYCQDNKVSWLDWTGLEKHRELYDYVRRLIAFRRAHPVLRANHYDFAHNGTGYPELSFHGVQPWRLDGNAPGLSFAYMYAEDHAKYGTEANAFIYVAVNAWWEEQRFALPKLPAGYRWRLAFEAYGLSSDVGREPLHDDPSGITLGPRTTAILIAEP